MRKQRLVRIGCSRGIILPSNERQIIGPFDEAMVDMKRDRNGYYWIVRPIAPKVSEAMRELDTIKAKYEPKVKQ